MSMFLCDFCYHACYLLCPPHPTQFDNAKILCLSRKSSPPAWRVSKWLKPSHCIQVVCMASWSTFGSHTHPSVFLCPTAVTLHLPLLMAVHSCVQCYCFKHYCYYSRLMVFIYLYFFCFCFLHYELHIPVFHILRVVDPHHVAPCKELVTVTVQAGLVLCYGYILEKGKQVEHKIPIPKLKTLFFIECSCYGVTICKMGNHAVICSHGH